MTDEIVYTIEEDGTVTFETEGISGQNHQSADEFLKFMEDFCGNERSTKKKPKAFNHHHHNHSHKAGI